MRKITLSGTPQEIGFQHGRSLSEEIHHNISFYKAWFLLHLGDENKVLESAETFKQKITSFNPDFGTEIDHIALGAEVPEPLWLYALNSRSELVVTQNPAECTAVVFPEQYLLGQTWDWAKNLEGNFVIMEIIFPSGHKIIQLTEAGIIGKIGLNNQGLGQTLNILRMMDVGLEGIPVHITMRAVLESSTLESALSEIDRSGHGKASNLILSQNGEAVNVEFAGDETYLHEIEDQGYIHTNHYRHAPESVRVPEDSLVDSVARYTTSDENRRRLTKFTPEDMVSILSDRSHPEHNILCDFEPFEFGGIGDCGTLATIVMDLNNLFMEVRVGNPSSNVFSEDEFKRFDFSP
jgi:isopenicillin-N N-acyltransferase-like protein